MARKKGHLGTVLAGGSPSSVGEVTEWSFDEDGEKLDASSIGGAFKESDVGQVEVTGTLRAKWDTSVAGQNALITVGAEVALELYPAGNTTGETRYTGNATVNRIGRRADTSSHVEIEFDFYANAGLPASAVP